MLTRELAIAEYEFGQVFPDRLTQSRHAHYVAIVEQSLDLYRNGIGLSRGDLHRKVHELFVEELECPARRINAFCKLLDEKSTYDRDHRGRSAQLRKTVFRLAAEHHPLVQRADRLFESRETKVKAEIAKQLGKSWTEIQRELFADVIQFHRLSKFEGYANAAELLSRYNVAQCQAVLYDAISMTVWAGDDFKSILRYAKLARLMHTIDRHPNGRYVFRFDGPASVLRQSRRYGTALARFLPALLACRDWKMQAVIQHRNSTWKNGFRLSPADGLSSTHAEPSDFDSKLEEKFAIQFGEEPREGWTLIREGEVLHANQKVFVPDFVFQHDSGVRVLMEIIGFWTPEYLAAKKRTLDVFHEYRFLLAVSHRLDWQEEVSAGPPGLTPPTDIIRYKTSLRVADVVDQLNRRLAQ